MVTIQKKDFKAFVEDFAGQFNIESKDAASVIFDDEQTHLAYVMNNDGDVLETGVQVFQALWYNWGNNAIVTVKKNAIVIDLQNKIAKVVQTKWVRRKK